MNAKHTWVQCQICGEIIRLSYPIDMDKMYIAVDCPNCGITTGLNLGDDKDEIYNFYNVNVDPRYYL